MATAFDPTIRHPDYDAFAPAWALMRDAMAGEDAIKAKGETYLPMKSGTRAIEDATRRAHAYETYKLRAEFPELVAPTVRGATGTILDKPATIELPSGLEPLRERATRDGLTLDALRSRIVIELMTVGRYGLLPGIAPDGRPHLAGYVTESIINWDATDSVTDFVMLNETGKSRDRITGKWTEIEQYRECAVEDGKYVSRVWTKGAASGAWAASEDVPATDRKRKPVTELPFVFIDTNDLTPSPDDVPLYGLAKIAVRLYRLDADYVFALHMTSEPTPVAIGFDEPATAVKNGLAPTSIGSSRLWLLPKGGDAKFLEFSGPGLTAQENAIKAALDRAMVFGAQLLTDSQRSAESGEAIRLRLGNQTATLKTIAMTSAAGLERALKNVAIWMGENPDEVSVKPNVEFFDRQLSAQEIAAVVEGWVKGAYSWRSAFDRLQKGGVIPPERTAEEEQTLIGEDGDREGDDADMRAAAMLPAKMPPVVPAA